MEFSGPEPADFANVVALNRAFLRRLRSPSVGRDLREFIPAAMRQAVEGLTDRHVERLAASPFLLLSLRERDADFWSRIARVEPAQDLFAMDASHHDDVKVPAMSFLWQLARRNPYAARLVSGGTTGWCDQIGEYTLLALLGQIQGRRDVLQPRFAGLDSCWQKLLGPGLSSEVQVRRSAHLACLQTLLTGEPKAAPPRMRAAACNSSAPVATIAGPRRMT